MNLLSPRAAAVLRFAWLLPLLGLVCLGFAGVGPRPATAGPVKLAVVVVFDQMRGDYPIRWQELFDGGGFRRLGRNGAWFQNCHYPYASTVTAAGHASVHTGCSPRTHGIIGNEWFDRASGAEVTAVSSPRYTRVPPVPGGDAKRNASAGPDRLLAPTLADALKAATGGRARVVSLSLKDRAAILPGGRRPDACYWFDTPAGEFVTSSCYRDMPHAWVRAFNDAHPADRWRGDTWDRLRPDLDYVHWSGPDDQPGEGKGSLQRRTFPHPMAHALEPKALYYQAVCNSPFGNDLLLELAERAIDAEELGRHHDPDLLCLSFSSNDLIGHTWGPDSQEVLDVTLRSDRVVRALLDHLDRTVGEGRYLLVVTSDHGICPLPEVAQGRGHDAGRIAVVPLRQKTEEFLDATFGTNPGQARWLENAPDSNYFPGVYLKTDVLAQRGLRSADVEAALAGWLVTQPGIQATYTRTQLLQGVPADDAVGQMVRRSYYPARSGDVVIVTKPYYFVSTYLTGTTHGTPHQYDTWSPFFVYGPGIRPGVRQDLVSPLATAAILAHGLGITPPAQAEAPVPQGLFGPAR